MKTWMLLCVMGVVCAACSMGDSGGGQTGGTGGGTMMESPYLISDLGDLGGAPNANVVINNAGEVGADVLVKGGTYRTVFIRKMQQTAVGPEGVSTYVTAINDSGRLVGYQTQGDGSPAAYVWVAGQMALLPRVANEMSEAMGVQGQGVVCGWSHAGASTQPVACIWQGDQLTSLGTMGGKYSVANAVNNQMQVVGFSELADGSQHAFWWEGGKMTDLGTLGGMMSRAREMNDAGQVVGDSTVSAMVDASYRTHGFFWQKGKMRDIGTLDNTRVGGRSEAWGINRQGQVVGRATRENDFYRAYIWQNGAIYDLNNLIPVDSGWMLTGAESINDAGEIVGQGTFQGAAHYFRMTLRHPLVAAPVMAAPAGGVAPAPGVVAPVMGVAAPAVIAPVTPAGPAAALPAGMPPSSFPPAPAGTMPVEGGMGSGGMTTAPVGAGTMP